MPILARIIFGCIERASRRGFTPPREPGAAPGVTKSPRLARRRTGVRGETFAYWYLRRHGYTIIARNFTVPGVKGEIDLVGYAARATGAMNSISWRATARCWSSSR